MADKKPPYSVIDDALAINGQVVNSLRGYGSMFAQDLATLLNALHQKQPEEKPQTPPTR
jgi:hypothetical protein